MIKLYTLPLALLLCTGPAFAGDDPLGSSSSPAPVQPDPVPGQAPRIPPQSATAPVAQPPTGVARHEAVSDCDAAHPCAVPTPALGAPKIAANRTP